jgi:pilus assembly protein Flp/PilA
MPSELRLHRHNQPGFLFAAYQLAGFSEINFTQILRGRSTLPAMIAKCRQFLADESGATAIEYGLIAAGISVAIISVVKGLGTKLNTTFSSISSQLK